MNKIVQVHKDQLPLKAKKEGYPVIYWVTAARHKLFKDLPSRTKFNLCLEATVKMFDNMRVIKIKELWNYKDPALVNNSEMTPTGL